MDRRPQRTDTEDEILEMQRVFLTEKAKNKHFQPAAQAIVVNKGKKQSVFAKSRSIKDTTKIQSAGSSIDVVLGDIVEKPNDTKSINKNHKISSAEALGFPEVKRAKMKINTSGKSLFALSVERKELQMEASSEESFTQSLEDSLGATSTIIQEQETAEAVHQENIEVLSQMSKEAILEEREKLLKSMDPKLIQFLTAKRKENIDQPKFQLNLKTQLEKEESIMEVDQTETEDILNRSIAEKWIHFDVIEKEKLEWMKDVPQRIANLKPGEKFEARFDWKGVLLPYTEEGADKDTRELYLHGDEPHRPGYTLQELFRLARSNVIQQRISSFSAIAGILNIYNQGFYDNVLQLPISKIFFLLRFGFDENSPAIIEIVAKALSVLFYNDTDETLLDFLSETPWGYLQPIMQLENEDDYTDSIEKDLKNMKLTSSPFSASIQESQEESKLSMNDFELAEKDLIECFLRTNIIQRISYILSTIRPENSTVISCLKILIRIARTNKDCAMKVIENEELIKILFTEFLPPLNKLGNKNEKSFYGFPQHLALKLLRIILSHELCFCLKLLSLGLKDCLRSYLFTREDMRGTLIRVQIEALRIVRALWSMGMEPQFYKELVPAFRYMLEWHYRNIIYEQGGPYLIRQHASALLNAVSAGPVNESKAALDEVLTICSCKWFHSATESGIEEFSQSILLSSILHCVAWYLSDPANKMRDFTEKYLRKFVESSSFSRFYQNLSRASILLRTGIDRRCVDPALLNIGSILVDSGSPHLMIPQTYPVFFLNTLFRLIEELYVQNDQHLIQALIKLDFMDTMEEYLKNLSRNVNKNVSTNFLAKNEIRLVFNLLRFDNLKFILPKSLLLCAAYTISTCMTSEHIAEIRILFTSIIFNSETLDWDQSVLDSWLKIYVNAYVLPHRIFKPSTEISLSVPCSTEPILATDWPYLMLKTLLNRYLHSMSATKIIPEESDVLERDLIIITLSFTALLERNGLEITSPTEKLMYLMIAFMGHDSPFLEKDTKAVLQEHITKFFFQFRNYNFKFDGSFEGKSKFENLYVLFLDCFQSSSYGDDVFSSLVMIPLAQKYDNKWRKMVWSEHAAVLRFINCKENQLLGSLETYLNPIETDVSLIKSYAHALNSNLLRINSIPYKIASHHLNNYKQEKS